MKPLADDTLDEVLRNGYSVKFFRHPDDPAHPLMVTVSDQAFYSTEATREATDMPDAIRQLLPAIAEILRRKGS